MINITEWSKISQESFKAFQFDSGMIVKNFDPETVTVPQDSDIVCTTTGNITATLVPTMANLGDDVNNLHVDASELAYIQKWVATLGFTALEMDANTFKLALGAADIASNKITPRMHLKTTDFETIALVMKLIGGGLAAVVIKNALSTGGLNITTSKEGKGNLAVTMTGFSTIAHQDEVPMEFYVIEPETEDTDEKEDTNVIDPGTGNTGV